MIVLAHHVDDWNRLGFSDPFSSPEATARQRAYAPLGGGSYTPQVVVDGQAERVGGRASAIEDAISLAAKRPHATIEVTLKNSELSIRVGPLPGDATDADLIVAVVQDRGRVAVPRGENAGKTLDHVAIVRSLRVVGAVPAPGLSTTTTVKAPAATGGPSVFTVVAFVQERSRRRVLGATSIPLP